MCSVLFCDAFLPEGFFPLEIDGRKTDLLLPIFFAVFRMMCNAKHDLSSICQKYRNIPEIGLY